MPAKQSSRGRLDPPTNVVILTYRSTHYYALDIQGGKLLVDCGWPNAMSAFAAELKRKGIQQREIQYILATHFHPDHAGLVEEFKRLGARLIMMESQSSAVAASVSPTMSKTPAAVTISPNGNLPLKFSESRSFLASIGLQGEILPTPGHSADSVSLLLDNGFLFTGDLPPRSIVADEDQLTKSSWDRIYNHKVTRIFPAHGTQN